MENYQNLLSECDAEIRAGRTQRVVVRLSKLNRMKIPREWKLPLANLCRRAGLFSRGLAILTDVIEQQDMMVIADPPSAAELAEYGVLLLRTGAINDAMSTLGRVDASAAPEALLYTAFGHFNRFEFQQAVPLLETYVQRAPDEYARLIGQVNLAFALVGSDRFDTARDVLDSILRSEVDKTAHGRLLSNCHSIRAQVHLHHRDFNAAQADLDASMEMLGSSQTHDQLFIVKWRAFLDSIRAGDIGPSERYRAHALEVGDWAGVREADLVSLKISFDKVRFNHLIFGTPFEGYRKKVCDELGRVPEQPIYVLGPKESPRLDLSTGKIDGSDALPAGRKCHQLLEALLRDFYTPIRIGGLFSELFPDEHFNVFTSPVRVRQLIRRTRRWMEAENIPMVLDERRGFYSLKLTGNFSVRIPLERKPVDLMNLHFQKLATHYNGVEMFSARDARGALNLGRTTIQRLVNWAIGQGKLVRVGERNSTLYKISSAS